MMQLHRLVARIVALLLATPQVQRASLSCLATLRICFAPLLRSKLASSTPRFSAASWAWPGTFLAVMPTCCTSSFGPSSFCKYKHLKVRQQENSRQGITRLMKHVKPSLKNLKNSVLLQLTRKQTKYNPFLKAWFLSFSFRFEFRRHHDSRTWWG